MQFECVPFAELFARPQKNGLTRPKRVRGTGLPMVNMGELFAYPRIDHVPMDLVPVSSAEEDFLLSPGDLLFARQSLVRDGAGQCSIFLGNSSPTVFESHLIRCRLAPERAIPDFYFYFFRSPQGRVAMDAIIEQGAGAAGIRGSDLVRLLVPAPTVSEQRWVSDALRTFDDRIDLLRQINATLEATAQALFKSWFIDFDPVRAKAEGREPEGMDAATAALFPAEFEESVVGPIPKGWSVTSIRDVARIVKGRSYKSSELAECGTALVTLKSFQRGGGFKLDGFKGYTGQHKEEQIVQCGECVVALTDVTQQAEVIGRSALVFPSKAHSTLVASLDVGIVRPVSDLTTPYFLHLLLQGERYVSHILGFTSGTTVLHLANEGVPSYRFALAPAEVVKTFDAIAMTIWNQRVHNESTRLQLTELRDTLLPRLISGQLRLPEAQTQVEESLA